MPRVMASPSPRRPPDAHPAPEGAVGASGAAGFKYSIQQLLGDAGARVLDGQNHGGRLSRTKPPVGHSQADGSCSGDPFGGVLDKVHQNPDQVFAHHSNRPRPAVGLDGDGNRRACDGGQDVAAGQHFLLEIVNQEVVNRPMRDRFRPRRCGLPFGCRGVTEQLPLAGRILALPAGGFSPLIEEGQLLHQAAAGLGHQAQFAAVMPVRRGQDARLFEQVAIQRKSRHHVSGVVGQFHQALAVIVDRGQGFHHRLHPPALCHRCSIPSLACRFPFCPELSVSGRLRHFRSGSLACPLLIHVECPNPDISSK